MFLILIQEFQALNFVLGLTGFELAVKRFRSAHISNLKGKKRRALNPAVPAPPCPCGCGHINGVRNGGEEEVRVQSLPALSGMPDPAVGDVGFILVSKIKRRLADSSAVAWHGHEEHV